MIYVGVDIAKSNHFATIISDSGKFIKKTFLFTNNILEFNFLFDLIKNFDKENLIIGLESTSIYHLNFVSFFFNKRFNIAIINPIITSKLRKFNIRPTKTDKIDCVTIVKSMILNGYSLFNQN